MTRLPLRLPQRQGRLVALAVAYHLARPGAELDRETMRQYEHGLAEVSRALHPQLDAVAGGRPRSAAPAFDDSLRSLFPEVAADPAAASDLAGEAAMLRRQLPLARARELLEEEHSAAGRRQRARKKPWQFWRR